jgi:predicted DNA-binding transcriptional regulator AlpA
MKGLRRLPELAKTLGVPLTTLRMWAKQDLSFPRPVDREAIGAGRSGFGRSYSVNGGSKATAPMYLLADVQAWFTAEQASDTPYKAYAKSEGA